MPPIMLRAIALFVLGHGLTHLMGFVAYWPLAEIARLPYKTTLLNGQWQVGETGIQLFSVLWLIPAVGFVAAAYGIAAKKEWPSAVMLITVLVSLMLTMLDWQAAFMGAIINVVILVVVIGWGGLQMKPASFPAYPEQTSTIGTIELPANLPRPVARFYNTIIRGEIPVIESAVITGLADLRFAGVTFPSRLRFTHDAGQGYRHYIEATIFGFPLLKVNETYLDGKARMELPFGVTENEPKIDMSANLGLWGESVWLPAVFLTNPRARWEVINDTTARLVVPFGEDEEDAFTVIFDPKTGLIVRMEAMRWRNAADEEKIRWVLEPLGWETFNGVMVPSPAAVTWEDEGTPWLVFTVEELVYNVDVSEYIRARGL